MCGERSCDEIEEDVVAGILWAWSVFRYRKEMLRPIHASFFDQRGREARPCLSVARMLLPP